MEGFCEGILLRNCQKSNELMKHYHADKETVEKLAR